MRCKFVLVCLAVVMAGASLAGAATLNVGPAQTYTTVQSAITAAQNGDTILIDPGTYQGKSATMYIDSKSNLVIKANGGVVVLDQNGPDNSVSGKGICNVVNSSTNIAFDGLTFVNAEVKTGDSGHNAAAITWEAAGLLRVSNCIIHDCEMALRMSSTKCSDILFENSVIYNCGGTGSRSTIAGDVAEGVINNFTMQYCWVYNGKADLIRVRARVMKFLYNRLGDEVTDPASGTWGGGLGYILKLDGGGLAYIIGNLLVKGGGSSNSQVCIYGGSSMYATYSNLSYWINNTFLNERIAGTTTTISMGGGQPPYVANNIWIHFNNANDTFCSNASFRPAGNTSNALVYHNTTSGVDTPVINLVNFLPTAPFDVHLLGGSTAIGIGLIPGGGTLPAVGTDTAHTELGSFSLKAIKQYVHPTTIDGLPGSENRTNWADSGMYALAANNSPSTNQAPIVTAGASGVPVGVTYPNRAVSQLGGLLMGAASDDGLPAGSSLSYTWTKISGPGAVAFANVNNPVTTATFSASGVYVLQLAASDGSLTGTATTTVWAEMPPTVNAGANQTVALNATVNLAGTASDDNLPTGSTLAYTWRSVTVPTGATVTFGTPAVLSTTATGFTVAGTYVLALDVSDSVFTTRSTVTITVQAGKTGDINHDGFVNVGDLQILVAAWASQKTPPSGNWNVNADINTDDFVNVGDLQLLVAHWNQ